MKPLSRSLIAVAALSLAALYVVPIWRIDLSAPQYPEGLGMKIWIDHLSGQIDQINGLNHYIGMAVITEDQFKEFLYMKYLVAVLIGLGLVAAAWNKRWLVLTWTTSIAAMGVLALYDMYQWGYKYGHELDPTAAIKVEGMAYQPPLIGFKQLLNFGAWSLPDIGGILLGLALLVGAGVCFYECYLRGRKQRRSQTTQTTATRATTLLA